MLQKILCGYITPISRFKSNPSAALAEAQGDAIAVSSNNQIQFYVVPAVLFEEMTAFCEYAQRDTSSFKSIPANFTGDGPDTDKVATDMAAKIKGAKSEGCLEDILAGSPKARLQLTDEDKVWLGSVQDFQLVKDLASFEQEVLSSLIARTNPVTQVEDPYLETDVAYIVINVDPCKPLIREVPKGTENAFRTLADAKEAARQLIQSAMAEAQKSLAELRQLGIENITYIAL